MKKTIIILIFILSCQLTAQDTNIVKYLPLKVGNVWVYNLNTFATAKISITGSTTTNNHTYFTISQQGYIFPCAPVGRCMSPLLDSLKPVRIDSVTGNIMRLGTSCSWHINENVMDTLKLRIGGTPNNCSLASCTDTSFQNIFGTQRKVKNMSFTSPPPYYYGRKYAYGIGIVNSNEGCALNYSCNYTLLGCVIDGVVFGDTAFIVGINQISTEIPESFSLYQNYPNPFNPLTSIKFSVPQKAFVTITIYNVLGEEVNKLVRKEFSPGTYETTWDASNYPSGVYYYQLKAKPSDHIERSDGYTETKKMVLIK